MRRRVLSGLIVLLAAGFVVRRRARRRATRLAGAADDAVIADKASDRKLLPNPQVEPENRPPSVRFLSIPWSPHPDPPPPDSTELKIHCTLTSEGMELARVDVRETASQVFVTVLARWEPGAEPGDTNDDDAPRGRKREATATLREPLGERALVHAPHDAPPR